MTINQRVWTDLEIAQISEIVRITGQANFHESRFGFDPDWDVLSVGKLGGDPSVVQIEFGHRETGKRLTVQIPAAQIKEGTYSPGASKYSDLVFSLSIFLQEFAGIVGLDNFADHQVVALDAQYSMSSLGRLKEGLMRENPPD